jgi:hypothetical protein
MQIYENLYDKNIRYKLNERDSKPFAEKSWLGKILSFPGRAARYGKAESVMEEYYNKLSSDIDKKIDILREQLPLRLEVVVDKVEKYIQEFRAVEEKHNEDSREYKIELKKLQSLEHNFLNKVEVYNDKQFSILDKEVEKLIDLRTKSLEDRISQPGVVFKSELSPEGKTELLSKWNEIINRVQEEYETKKLQFMNESVVKEIEDLISTVKAITEESRYGSSYKTSNNKTQFKDRRADLYDDLETLLLTIIPSILRSIERSKNVSGGSKESTKKLESYKFSKNILDIFVNKLKIYNREGDVSEKNLYKFINFFVGALKEEEVVTIHRKFVLNSVNGSIAFIDKLNTYLESYLNSVKNTLSDVESSDEDRYEDEEEEPQHMQKPIHKQKEESKEETPVEDDKLYVTDKSGKKIEYETSETELSSTSGGKSYAVYYDKDGKEVYKEQIEGQNK